MTAFKLASLLFASSLLAMTTPPNPTRQSAPPGIEARALQAGAQAPGVDLPAADGARWSLRDALARGPAVLVFYRGSW